jgi:hypothetical protein
LRATLGASGGTSSRPAQVRSFISFFLSVLHFFCRCASYSSFPLCVLIYSFVTLCSFFSATTIVEHLAWLLGTLHEEQGGPRSVQTKGRLVRLVLWLLTLLLRETMDAAAAAAGARTSAAGATGGGADATATAAAQLEAQRCRHYAEAGRQKVSFLLFTVTFYANLAHNLTRSP